jgi:hypothetical protein
MRSAEGYGRIGGLLLPSFPRFSSAGFAMSFAKRSKDAQLRIENYPINLTVQRDELEE